MNRVFALTDPYTHTGWKLFFMLLGPSFTIVALCFAAWTSVRFARNRSGRKALAAVLIGATLLASWWIAIPIARRWTGWADLDHDGMLDGFAAGRYDSVDIYGGHWGFIVLGVAVVGMLALGALRRNSSRSCDGV